MDIDEILDGMERRAEALGLSMCEVCRRSGVAHTTYYRWRLGQTLPSMRILQRLDSGLAESERVTRRAA